MACVRQLIQASLILSLRGKTLAGANVLDSQIEALSSLISGSGQPLIVISVEETAQPHEEQYSFLGRAQDIKILVQTAVATQVTIESGNVTDGPADFQIAATDSGLEAQLNLLDYQWRAILSNAFEVWPGHLRTLLPRIDMIRDLRVSDPETGRKLASRMTEISAQALPDPPYGQPVPEDINRILTALSAQTIIPDYQEIANLWRDVLSVPGNYDQWGVLTSSTGLSDAALLALGLGPLSANRQALMTLGLIAMPDRPVKDVVA
jgi:hypothetical protein